VIFVVHLVVQRGVLSLVAARVLMVGLIFALLMVVIPAAVMKVVHVRPVEGGLTYASGMDVDIIVVSLGNAQVVRREARYSARHMLVGRSVLFPVAPTVVLLEGGQTTALPMEAAGVASL
jgi:hypothetical protein